LAGNYKDKAFISYSHRDEKWAAWLHKALETYRVPSKLVGHETEFGPVPERIAPVFRDREELPTATSLGDTLTQALRDSACQIVICSPNAAQSRWTNEEIRTFKRLGRSDRIFCLIVAGEPGASGNPATAGEECFPPALIYELGPHGELTDMRSEPIAADARPGKDPKQAAKLKLIAGMLGVGYDALRQREAHRRHVRMMVLTTAAFTGMAITSALAVTAYFARVEAVEQRNEAEIKAETARQTAEFMVNLFKVSDPSATLGNTITAREILDRGAERVELELAGQPPIQATLMDTIGVSYMGLGLYDEALPLVAKSLETRRALFGEDHADSASSMSHLGEVQALKAFYDDAERNLSQALAVRRELLGDAAPEVADTLTHLSWVMTRRGEYAEAEPLIRESLDIRRAAFGEKHPDVAESLEALALNLFDQGDLDAAEPLLREAVAMRRELQSAVAPELASAINNLGFVLLDTGEYEEAEALFEEALEIKRTVLPAGHAEIAMGLNNVAYVLHVQGDYAAAEPMYRELIAAQENSLGAGHPDVAGSMNNLAFLYHDQGRREEAIALAHESLDIKRRAFGNSHPEVARSLNTIAMWNMEQGDYESAEPMLRESLEMNREMLGNAHPDVASSMALLASCLVGNGAYDEAYGLAVDARGIFTAALSAEHWRTAVAISTEGAALAGLKRYAEAEPLLVDSYALLSEDSGAMSIFVTEAAQRLADLYSAWGKPEKAAQYLATLQAN
jgi:tetratricopeptide (TPR) repeat protein